MEGIMRSGSYFLIDAAAFSGCQVQYEDPGWAWQVWAWCQFRVLSFPLGFSHHDWSDLRVRSSGLHVDRVLLVVDACQWDKKIQYLKTRDSHVTCQADMHFEMKMGRQQAEERKGWTDPWMYTLSLNTPCLENMRSMVARKLGDGTHFHIPCTKE